MKCLVQLPCLMTHKPNATKGVGNLQGIIGIFSLQFQYLFIILQCGSILSPLLVNLRNVGVSDNHIELLPPKRQVHR